MIVESYEDVIILSGALNANYWETIHTAISLTLKRHPSGVIIDCGGVTEATGEGALTFHDALDFVSEHDQARIIVANVPPQVLEVLKDAPEVRSQLPIVATVEEARRSLDLLSQGAVTKKERDLERKRVDLTVLSVLTGDPSDVDVMVVTREMVNNLAARVTILLPVIVPRELPLTAPMPDVEERLSDASAHGKDVLIGCETPSEVRLERARDLSTLVAEMSEELTAAYTILAIPDDSVGHEKSAKLIRAVLDKMRRPVLFVRGDLG